MIKPERFDSFISPVIYTDYSSREQKNNNFSVKNIWNYLVVPNNLLLSLSLSLIDATGVTTL
jgi:hypothetical protein